MARPPPSESTDRLRLVTAAAMLWKAKLAPHVCFDLRCYLNNLSQELRHFSVGSAVVSVRLLSPISQTDFKSLRLRSVQQTISFRKPCRLLNRIAGVLKKIDK